MTIEPDTKDWTWVLERPCPECGLEASALDPASYPALLRANTATWLEVLSGDDLAQRPGPGVWSPLEYACHVHDVHVVFGDRLARMLAEDDPHFANWDQDATAVEKDYEHAVPVEVAEALAASGEALARGFERVGPGGWARPGTRSNGSVFTVESLGRYLLHDLIHHVHDVAP